MVIKGIQSGAGISQAFPVDKLKTVKPTGDATDTGKFVGQLVNKVNDQEKQSQCYNDKRYGKKHQKPKFLFLPRMAIRRQSAK